LENEIRIWYSAQRKTGQAARSLMVFAHFGNGRRRMSDPDPYETDFHAWALAQAALLRSED